MYDVEDLPNSLNDLLKDEEKHTSLGVGEQMLKSKIRSLRKRKKVIKAEQMQNYTIPNLRKVRQDLTLKDKIKILELLGTDPRTPQRVIASTFKVSQSQISRIYNNREEILKEWQNGNAERKRNRKGKGGMVELKLLEWYNEAKEEGLPISGPTLMEKAKRIVEDLNLNFVPTSGWFGRWKNRNGISLKVPVSKNEDGSVSYSKISSHWRRYTFTKIIKDYNLEDVWFLDSLQILSNFLPIHLKSSFQLEESDNGMLVILFAFNYLGTKRKNPLIVGTESTFMNTPLSYYTHMGGEVTKELFSEWLVKWDLELKAERRRISLILCRAPYVSEGLHFHCINLHYFPEGDAASLRLQPFYFNIATTFKALFRHQVASHYLSKSTCKELISNDDFQGRFQKNISTFLSLVDRIYMIKRAWKHIHPDVFVRGIVKAGLSRKVQSLTIEADVSPPPGMSKEEFDQFVHIEDTLESINSPSNEGLVSESQTTQPPKETLDFEALLACNTLREYLQRSSSNLVDKLAEIETAIQRGVIMSSNPVADSEPSIDPFFDSSSIHSMEAHKTSVVKEETSQSDERVQLHSPVQSPSPVHESSLPTGISVGALPIQDYTNHVNTNKYVDNYSIATNSQEILISQPPVPPPPPLHHVVCENLKSPCQVGALPHDAQGGMAQYQTNYIQTQSVELKSIPIGIPRTVSDVNLDRFTLHSEMQHPRPINDVTPSHIIPATQITNSTPTFITFASHF